MCEHHVHTRAFFHQSYSYAPTQQAPTHIKNYNLKNKQTPIQTQTKPENRKDYGLLAREEHPCQLEEQQQEENQSQFRQQFRFWQVGMSKGCQACQVLCV